MSPKRDLKRWPLLGSQVAVKSAQLTWKTSQQRWRCLFCNVRLPMYGGSKAPFDVLLLSLYTPRGIYVYEHDLVFGATSNGGVGQQKETISHTITVYGPPQEEDWRSALDTILMQFDGAGCKQLGFIAFGDDMFLDALRNNPPSRTVQVFRDAPLVLVDRQERHEIFTRLAIILDRDIHPSSEFEDPGGYSGDAYWHRDSQLSTADGLSSADSGEFWGDADDDAGMGAAERPNWMGALGRAPPGIVQEDPTAELKHDWRRDGLRVAFKSAQLSWVKSQGYWAAHWLNVKLPYRIANRFTVHFDELILALYTPDGIVYFRHDGRLGVSHQGRNTEQKGHVIGLYGARGLEDWKAALDVILRQVELSGCQMLARVDFDAEFRTGSTNSVMPQGDALPWKPGDNVFRRGQRAEREKAPVGGGADPLRRGPRNPAPRDWIRDLGRRRLATRREQARRDDPEGRRAERPEQTSRALGDPTADATVGTTVGATVGATAVDATVGASADAAVALMGSSALSVAEAELDADGECALSIEREPCPNGDEDDGWLETWRKNIEEWWAITPFREGLTQCLGAFALSLASRLERALLAWRAGEPSEPPARSGEDECDWVHEGSGVDLKLPQFPDFPPAFEMTPAQLRRLLIPRTEWLRSARDEMEGAVEQGALATRAALAADGAAPLAANGVAAPAANGAAAPATNGAAAPTATGPPVTSLILSARSLAAGLVAGTACALLLVALVRRELRRAQASNHSTRARSLSTRIAMRFLSRPEPKDAL